MVVSCDQNFVNVNVISLFTICVKREIHELHFSLFFMLLSEKLVNFKWFHVKLLKLRESDVNRNPWHRTKEKRDSVKCWKFLSNVNFSWTWIHWPITSLNPLTLCNNETADNFQNFNVQTLEPLSLRTLKNGLVVFLVSSTFVLWKYF